MASALAEEVLNTSIQAPNGSNAVSCTSGRCRSVVVGVGATGATAIKLAPTTAIPDVTQGRVVSDCTVSLLLILL
nr:hypothetical protein CPGR_02525 [Mycolicibacter nonchromogenicus]